MGANSEIGQIQTYYILSKNQAQEDVQTNISKGFTVNPATTYSQIDAASRALTSLTTNVYYDTQLITIISVNEVLAG